MSKLSKRTIMSFALSFVLVFSLSPIAYADEVNTPSPIEANDQVESEGTLEEEGVVLEESDEDAIDVLSAETTNEVENLEVVEPQSQSDSKSSSTLSVSPLAGSPSVSYRTHVQRVGWQNYVKDGATSGTSGKALRLEGINIKLSNVSDLGIKYRTHVQNVGWQAWKSNGQMSGTSGKSLRLEAIQIELTGSASSNYDIYYRVHSQNYGWLGWAKNGQVSGTSYHAFRLEAIQIKLVAKGGKAPGSTVNPSVQAFSIDEGTVMYQVNKERKKSGRAYVTGNKVVHDATVDGVKELGAGSISTKQVVAADPLVAATGYTTAASAAQACLKKSDARKILTSSEFNTMGVAKLGKSWCLVMIKL